MSHKILFLGNLIPIFWNKVFSLCFIEDCDENPQRTKTDDYEISSLGIVYMNPMKISNKLLVLDGLM